MFDLLHGFQTTTPLASLEDIIGIGGSMLVIFSIPIVAILTNHQRKMAEIMRSTQTNNQTDPMIQQQLASMQAQIADMRSMMQEHIINNDRTPLSESVEQRLNS